MSWRPEGFNAEEIATKIQIEAGDIGSFDEILWGVEAGADAMLEALKATTEYVRPENANEYGFHDVSYYLEGRGGWPVWIPDDTEKEEADGSTD